MKGKIIDTIASAQKMIEEPEFINLVQKDCKVFRSIDKDLSIRHEDMKRDCAIIFAGRIFIVKYVIITTNVSIKYSSDSETFNGIVYHRQ